VYAQCERERRAACISESSAPTLQCAVRRLSACCVCAVRARVVFCVQLCRALLTCAVRAKVRARVRGALRALPPCATDFWDRIQRGNNITKIGNATNPRDVASQIAAQARAAVDCPTLQCVGPQSTNQALKAVAIARTYLQQSDQSGASSHPDIVVYPEFVHLTGDEELSAISMRLSKRSRRPGVDGKEGRTLKVGNQTDPKYAALLSVSRLARWPIQDSLSLVFVCARINYPCMNPPIRITHTTAILLRDFCAIYNLPRPSLYMVYTIHYSEGQYRVKASSRVRQAPYDDAVQWRRPTPFTVGLYTILPLAILYGMYCKSGC